MKKRWDKFDYLLALSTFIVGAIIIFFLQSPGDLYHFIPLAIFWIIRFLRWCKKEKREEKEREVV